MMKKNIMMYVAIVAGMLSFGALSASAADTFVSETDSTPHFSSSSDSSTSSLDKQAVTATLASAEQRVYNVSESNSVPGSDNGQTVRHESEIK